jgi:hypothetical protein
VWSIFEKMPSPLGRCQWKERGKQSEN